MIGEPSVCDEHACRLILERLDRAPSTPDVVRQRIQQLAGTHGRYRGSWAEIDVHGVWRIESGSMRTYELDAEICAGLTRDDRHAVRELLELDHILDDVRRYTPHVMRRRDGHWLRRHVPVDLDRRQHVARRERSCMQQALASAGGAP